MTENENLTFRPGFAVKEILEREPSLHKDLVAAYMGLSHEWDEAARLQQEGTANNRRENFYGFYLNDGKLLPVYENGRGGLRVINGPMSFSKNADQLFVLEKQSLVGLGSVVTLYDPTDQRTFTYKIVSKITDENQLQADSSDGEKLLGKGVGDSIVISVDGNPVSLRVTHVQ